jgi:hypothetical protein
MIISIFGLFLRGEFIGDVACDGLPCTSIFAAIILGYGACLGSIGAITYELFHASGIVKSSDYGVFDKYRSTARIVLGITFGFIFSITVSMPALGRVFNVDLTGETDAATTTLNYALIMLPLLVGYSSSLITGILDRFVDAINVFFGIRAAAAEKGIGKTTP